jgi:hypothetical protein
MINFFNNKKNNNLQPINHPSIDNGPKTRRILSGFFAFEFSGLFNVLFGFLFRILKLIKDYY